VRRARGVHWMLVWKYAAPLDSVTSSSRIVSSRSRAFV
jgi:hypothetical protein